jgi:hypothetical protein
MTRDAQNEGDSPFLFFYFYFYYYFFLFPEESERCQILNIEKVGGGGGRRLVRWLVRGPSDFIRKVRRFLGPQGFTVGLRAGGGRYLGVDGRKQVRHQHRRWVGLGRTNVSGSLVTLIPGILRDCFFI